MIVESGITASPSTSTGICAFGLSRGNSSGLIHPVAGVQLTSRVSCAIAFSNIAIRGFAL